MLIVALDAVGAQIYGGIENKALAQFIPQITPDNTLGSESSTVTPQNQLVDKVDGGAIRGSNLFHSFQEFNVGEGRSVYFANPVGIENIISRVTGRNRSQLLGTLGVLGKANLFLINPNGIIFGANAKLDVGGSFVASTASSLVFADGTKFSVINSQAPPLLTLKVPIGLEFENIPGAISLQSARLVMQPDKTLALVGGNVSLDNSTILAPGGRVELGGLAQKGTVTLNQNGSLSFPVDVVRADVSLTQGSQVNVRAGKAGSIAIATHNLNIAQGSTIRAGIASGQGAVDSKAGDIEINATDAVTLTGTGSFISNAVLPNARGKGGNVNLTARSLAVTGGFQIFAGTYGNGDVGDVNINVSDTVLFDGIGTNGINTGGYSSIADGGTGRGGNLNITAKSLAVTNGAILEASTVGRGDAGSVNVNVSDTALFDGEAADFKQVSTFTFSSGAYSRVDPRAVGNAGSVNVSARTVKVSNGAVLTTSTDGKGNAGNVTINARDIVLDGEGRFNNTPGFGFFQSSGAFSSVKRKGDGIGGNIIVNANTLSLSNGAVIVTSTRGRGDAGDILINRANTVTVAGVAGDGYSSGLYSNTEPIGIGQGGEITVNTATLRVVDGGVINALTANAGRGGSIVINAQTLEATNGGQIVTSTRSSGNAGNIKLNVSDSINLVGSDLSYGDRALKNIQIGLDTFTNQGAASGVLASTDVNATGNGGNVFILSKQVNLRDRGVITVSSQGSGVAGNIEISAKTIHLQNQGAITGETKSANGGNVFLQVQDLLLMSQNSLISTTAGTGQAPGNGGNIKIDARNGFIIGVPQENNDIIANAFAGQGGLVEINAQRVFGLESREQLTQQSDITAFSQTNPQLNGAIEINTLGIDPTQGLVNLPSEPRSVEISEGCQVRSANSKRVRFINQGRGGIPSRPEEPQNVEMFLTRWIDLDTNTEAEENSSPIDAIINSSNGATGSTTTPPNSTCQGK
ncbi:filamentous hemagglutinin N-terminal domain-containing protein [Nostocaceae cyanobacterium CENA369]|uniref:Filamentous hemagglutinin N-terminal domain-containing protein n=1 Tax=Dendronalium phyllosphericum CENA369 TaxID=1725256 RepID=A0A8J7LDK2_9NOST|nr:filamentous hemagglutinin N-terminal domain-containing protein [Dendronalium phyllosphericum]MBH8571759.1 filamentous hemagglutinin N-terminal domain-containing protein [Dendronalium phyllosphericum CENA369]